MELTEQRKAALKEKQSLVRALSNSIVKGQPNVVDVDYAVFVNESKGWTQEYLVIRYAGGAMTVRNCNGNSFSAIFDEISEYLNSGYYSEVEDYKAMLIDTDWNVL